MPKRNVNPALFQALLAPHSTYAAASRRSPCSPPRPQASCATPVIATTTACPPAVILVLASVTCVHAHDAPTTIECDCGFAAPVRDMRGGCVTTPRVHVLGPT